MFNPLPYSSCEPLADGVTHFSRTLTISGLSSSLQAQLQRQAARFGHPQGIDSLEVTVTAQGNPEAYDIFLNRDRATVTAYGEKGIFYAVQTLLRLMEEPELPCVKLHNEPVCPFRGVKVFLPEPSEKGFADFRQLIDFIARCRYNTLVVEIGGAMEYKKHPEINEGWLEYAAFMNEYSGKPTELFRSIPWAKNSVHATNGGGKVLTQQQVRELIDTCEKRGLEITPELPSLSHCDFLLTRHHELAERPEDPYPDTICPNHPDYYPLLFDLIDELIDVFHPKRIHLGHDEYYSIGLCPRCQGKPAPNIYADDIKKCYDYLKERNIKMMIWSEKLLNAHFLGNNLPIGGASFKSWTAPESGNVTPATYPAIDLIPQDIEMMHWYWSIDRTLEQSYIDRNMTMIFGNFRADAVPDWKKRRQAPNFVGTTCSNWGSMDWLTMQRNALLSEIAYASTLHWNPNLDSDDFYDIRDWALDELYAMHLNHETAPLLLEVTHTTDKEEEYRCFYDGVLVEKEKDLLGWHVFQDTDGKQLKCPVYYGCNIASQNVSMGRGELGLDLWKKDHDADSSDIYKVDRRFWEVSYETRPEIRDGKLFCRCVYPLTETTGALTYQGFTPAEGFTGSVQLADFQIIRR